MTVRPMRKCAFFKSGRCSYWCRYILNQKTRLYVERIIPVLFLIPETSPHIGRHSILGGGNPFTFDISFAFLFVSERYEIKRINITYILMIIFIFLYGIFSVHFSRICSAAWSQIYRLVLSDYQLCSRWRHLLLCLTMFSPDFGAQPIRIQRRIILILD